jgi:hypothetical protein
MSWPDFEQAKRGAESLALCSLPLDANIAARIKRTTRPRTHWAAAGRPVAMPVVDLQSARRL